MESNAAYKLGMGQLLVVGGQRDANLGRADRMVRRAADAGCSIVVLPECLDLGWTNPTVSELAARVEQLARARQESPTGADLAQQVSLELEHLRVCPIDYRALSFAQGSDRSRDGSATDTWRELSRALTDEGHEPLEAANARQGLDAYRVVRPALAVVDLCHGESEGLTFIRDLLGEDPDAAFLALCPDPLAPRFDPLTLTDVFGAEVVVQKPRTDREVVRIVSNWGAR